MKRIAVVVAVTFAFTFAGPILGQTADPPKAGETLRKLSKKERRARLTKLDVRFQLFLTDVEPLLAPSETDAFLLLETDQQRDSFIDDFWRKREALAGKSTGPTQSFKDVYYERLDNAKQLFRDIASDRSKMYLIHGAPAAVARTNCQRIQPTEVWIYEELPGLGQFVRVLFYKPRNHNDFKLWNPLGGTLALAELMPEDANPSGDASTRRSPTEAAASSSPYNYVNRIQLECPNGDELLKAITQMIQSRVDLLRLFDPTRGDAEETKQLLRSAVIVNPNAPKLTADFSVRYPTKDGSRTDVQMMLLVPRGELSPAEVGGAEVYTIDVVGEVLKEGKLWEKYRYRFDFPAETKGEQLPIVIDRLLRPNSYTARIKVIDANGGAEALVERDLEVPEIFLAEPEAVPAAAQVATTGQAGLPVLHQTAAPVKPALRLIPPPGEIVSGVQTFDTILEGDGIKGVEFWLDGKKLAVRRAAPFALDIDLGEVPQMRRVRAVALDAKGKALTGDDVQVNSGTEPFRVRIASPRVAPNVSGPTRVEIDVRIPDGEQLGKLELFWNDRRVATLYDPPFVQMVDIPATDGVGYLRAVASLEGDSGPPLEDVVMVNTPAYMEEMNVHLVELPTTVLVGGKPSDKLTEKDFKVLDDGKAVTLSKFEFVKNLPLSIGMAIDTSGSMQRIMEEAQKAGAQFFQKVMKKGDKGFLLEFNEQARMVQPWSGKLADMHAGLAKLRAEETTALYDAVVESLYNFQGVRGQKALVLISDGKDTASKYSFDQALEYARRSAVPIYAIAIGMKGTEVDVRSKLQKLCSETGGTVYEIQRAFDLVKIYDDIQTELRSQYVLGFYPPADVKAGSKWREVEVKVSEGKARTIRGYYP